MADEQGQGQEGQQGAQQGAQQAQGQDQGQTQDARHVQQSGEQAAQASAPPAEQAQAPQRAVSHVDQGQVDQAAAEIYAQLQSEEPAPGGAPEGAQAGMTVPPEVIEQLQSLSQAALAFLIRMALAKLGSF